MTIDYDRYLYLRFQLDTNRINSRQSIESMNLLERWAADELIELLISETAQDEARQGGSPARSKKALGYIFSETLANTADEQVRLRQIERILFPQGAQNDNQHRDVEIVFNAGKYGAILVTNDGGSRSQPGGILGNRGALAAMAIRVVTDDEAVQMVRDAIRNRDDMARMLAEYDGTPLPAWVGQD